MADKYIVYSDGACAPTNPGPAAWGAVVIDEDGCIRMFKGFLGHGTNQVAEVSAALQGILCTPPGSYVELVSDSQYTLKGISEWRAGWIRRGWKNAAGEPIANKALWQKLFAAVDERTVKTRWVKGHAGDEYNEEADRLANAGLKCELGEIVEENPAPISTPASTPKTAIDSMKLDELYLLVQRLKNAAVAYGRSNKDSIGHTDISNKYFGYAQQFDEMINELHEIASPD